jgi:hypothetical protein
MRAEESLAERGIAEVRGQVAEVKTDATSAI